MRTLVWVGIGALLTALTTAVAARLAPAHVVPDAAVLVAAFVALRREPVPIAATALALGYLVGRQAGAPAGLHEVALVLVALGVYLMAGSISGSGTLFFAVACGGATMALHALLWLMLIWQQEHAGFASVATALLVPCALATATLGLLLHRPLLWLDRRLTQDRSAGLTWR